MDLLWMSQAGHVVPIKSMPFTGDLEDGMEGSLKGVPLKRNVQNKQLLDSSTDMPLTVMKTE